MKYDTKVNTYMASRSLNKAILIGNVVADPKLRITPNGSKSAYFAIATNREYTSSDGKEHSESEYTNIITWEKLAEICVSLVRKGTKCYVEGRLKTSRWKDKENIDRVSTEVIADQVIILKYPNEKKDEDETGNGLPISE